LLHSSRGAKNTSSSAVKYQSSEVPQILLTLVASERSGTLLSWNVVAHKIKKLKKIIFILLFLPVFVNAQINIDSLKGVWNDETQADTIRIQAMKDIAWKGYLFSQPDSAFYFSQLLINFAEEKGQNQYISDALSTQGVSFNLRADFDNAIQYYLKSIKIDEEEGNKGGIAKTLNRIGITYSHQDKFSKSIEYYGRSLVLRKEMGDKKGISDCLNNIGVVNQKQSDYDEAMVNFTKSLTIQYEIGNKMAIGNSLNNIGLIFYEKGNNDKAIEYYNKSLIVREEIGHKKGVSDCFNNIGSVYFEQGDYNNAINYYKKGLSIQEEIGYKKGLANSLNNIGGMYVMLKEYNKGVDFYTQSLNLHKQIGSQIGIADCLHNLGSLYSDQQEYDKAMDFLQNSVELKEEIGDKDGVARSLISIGLIYKTQGDYDKASDYFKRSFTISEEINNAASCKNAVQSLFQISCEMDSLNNSITYANLLSDYRIKDLEVNFPVLSEVQKELYFLTMQSDFDLLHDFTAHNPKLKDLSERSYNNTLLTKGLLLKSSTAMRNAIYQSEDTLLTKHYNNWIMLKRKIAKAYASNSDTKNLEKEANILEQNLIKSSKKFSELNEVQSITWLDVQSKLKKGEVAIEFICFAHTHDYKNESEVEQLYTALIINKESNHPKMIRLFTEEKLQQILGTFPGNNLSYIQHLYGTKEAANTELYNLIWKPLEEELKGATKVFASPTGLLHKISFSALAKNSDTFLSDLYDIEIMASTGKIAIPTSINFNKESTTTLFGGIDYNSDSTSKVIWDYLEGTLEETIAIEKALKKQKQNYNYFTGNKATEEQLKSSAETSNIIHIATHGFFYPDPDKIKEETTKEEVAMDITFRGGNTGMGMNTFVNSRNPLMRSGLAFAKANDVWSHTDIEGEDGVLTAEEVATINMQNTDLVVLSACETGLGDIKGSEGVYGLQRSFKMAGVRYLIMSLWQVPDKETVEFMTSFYKHLNKTNDIKKSFSLTQKAMRKKYDPYFWAAFVLIE